MKYTLDAKGKRVGRIATEIAVLLMGKNRTDYARNKIPSITVEVLNAGNLTMQEKKLQNKTYHSHSGYPGALKTTTASQIKTKKGMSEVLRRAVYGMLPKNKLRPRMMKNLDIKE